MMAGHETRERDIRIVTAQLGRGPRGRSDVAARCRFGHPTVIETEPLLDDGTPFPTLLYLTCPWLVRRLGELESAGAVAEWRRRLNEEPPLAARMYAADAQYRSRRAAAAGGVDPVPDVGIAGQREPCATKCLHAHVAAFLGGIDDPVGETVLAHLEIECPDDECAGLLVRGDGVTQTGASSDE